MIGFDGVDVIGSVKGHNRYNYVFLQDDAACEICKLIVTYLDQILQDNKTIATVNSTLYAFCSGLPDPWNTTVSFPGVHLALMLYYIIQSTVLMTLRKKVFEDIVGKRAFCLFPIVFTY